MYVKDSLQPIGVGMAFDKIGVVMKEEIYFSTKDSRGYTTSTMWAGRSRWNNVGGYGWYVLGPLNMVKWSSE